MKEKLDLEFANFEEQKDYDSAKARMLSTIEEKATSKEEMNMYWNIVEKYFTFKQHEEISETLAQEMKLQALEEKFQPRPWPDQW